MEPTDYGNSSFPDLTQKVIGLQNDIAGAFIGTKNGEGFTLDNVDIAYGCDENRGIIGKVFLQGRGITWVVLPHKKYLVEIIHLPSSLLLSRPMRYLIRKGGIPPMSRAIAITNKLLLNYF
jgi:hypothetical protein